MREKLLGKKTRNELATVPALYRMWSWFVNKCDSGGWQVLQVMRARDVMSPNELTSCLAEVMTRATFEVAMGLHFDGNDTQTDEFVQNQIVDLFGPAAMLEVYAAIQQAQAELDISGRVLRFGEALIAVEVEIYSDGDTTFAEHEAP